jgi:hypothetical protein
MIVLHLARRTVVVALATLCGLLDALPWLPGPVTRFRCPNGMAALSERLDQRWGTGVWK